MANKIMNGFPLRRCSWLYMPVVPALSTRVMIRWLDSVCASRVAQKQGSRGRRVVSEVKGLTLGQHTATRDS
jgi:hypothetical protein